MKTPKTPNRKKNNPVCDAVQAFGTARLIPGDESRSIAGIQVGKIGGGGYGQVCPAVAVHAYSFQEYHRGVKIA